MTKTYRAIAAILMILIANASAAEKKMGGISLDRSSMTQMELPQTGDIPFLLLDFEYPQNEKPRVVHMDFNGDGNEDYFIESWRSLCGTGGCLYALIDGNSKKRIGDFFGAPIFVLDQKINGFPVIQSYSHMSRNSGNFNVYVFDGKKYQVVSSVYLIDESVKELFKSLDNFKQIKTIK